MNEYIISDEDMFDIYNKVVNDSDTKSYATWYSPTGIFIIVKSDKDLVDFTNISGAEYIRKIG